MGSKAMQGQGDAWTWLNIDQWWFAGAFPDIAKEASEGGLGSDEVMLRVYEDLQRIVRRILRSQPVSGSDVVEDAVQNALLRLAHIQPHEQFDRDRGNARAHLIGIVRNVTLETARQSSRGYFEKCGDGTAGGTDPSKIVEAQELLCVVLGWVKDLPLDSRQAVESKYCSISTPSIGCAKEYRDRFRGLTELKLRAAARWPEGHDGCYR